MRTCFFAGNWKMNKTPREAAVFARELLLKLRNSPHTIMVAPAFVSLPTVLTILKDSNIAVAAQNMATAEAGPYTGEISPDMLCDLGVNMVIIGHSERRILFAETDEIINKKICLALSKGMKVIFCIGETLDEREAGMLREILRRQISTGLKTISANDMSRITIAYEPVWAIGTGKNATPDDADNAHAFIRQVLTELYSPMLAEKTIIQYGGSVKPSNIRELMAIENVDGALVGGASLNIDDFSTIIQFDL